MYSHLQRQFKNPQKCSMLKTLAASTAHVLKTSPRQKQYTGNYLEDAF